MCRPSRRIGSRNCDCDRGLAGSACRVAGGCAKVGAMRAHNYYASPGFERAGLRRRDGGWIVERVADPASLFVPVWRNQNLVVEIADGEPRAAVLDRAGLVRVLGDGAPAEERLDRGEIVFLGVVAERAHFALDLSPAEAPLDLLRQSAAAAIGIAEAALRVRRSASVGRAARPPRRGAVGACPGDALFWHVAPPLLRAMRQPDPQRGGRACAALHRPGLQHDAFSAHRSRRHHAGDPRRARLGGPVAAFSARHVFDPRRLCRAGREPRRGGRPRGARGDRHRSRRRRLPFVAALAISGQHHAGVSRPGADRPRSPSISANWRMRAGSSAAGCCPMSTTIRFPPAAARIRSPAGWSRIGCTAGWRAAPAAEAEPGAARGEPGVQCRSAVRPQRGFGAPAASRRGQRRRHADQQQHVVVGQHQSFALHRLPSNLMAACVRVAR